jgi:hypothetical protein
MWFINSLSVDNSDGPPPLTNGALETSGVSIDLNELAA